VAGSEYDRFMDELKKQDITIKEIVGPAASVN
jgi:hypothetical protein